ncbi:hypothetical protein [Halobaculum litoreum]|uniref:Uncharacterized protein n=1 Tax=Halobaculum litoreum TaxID=3031998 RepID=A0ABD5XLG0_9EURY|nr:hypothetical protein [Halobaculum sp. DT92]
MSSPRSGSGRRPVRVLALLVVALSVATLVSVAAVDSAARAPPRPVCDVCADGAVPDAAAERGVAVAVGASSLDLHVRADGSTRRVARLGFLDGADELRNASLRRAVVDAALDGSEGQAESRLEGDTLVVEYSRTGVARRESGAVVVTAFHAAGAPPLATGGEGTAVLGADELVVYAPAGYVPAGGAADGRVVGRTVHWNADGAGADGIDRDARPTFVPDDASFPEVRGAVARLLLRL